MCIVGLLHYFKRLRPLGCDATIVLAAQFSLKIIYPNPGVCNLGVTIAIKLRIVSTEASRGDWVPQDIREPFYALVYTFACHVRRGSCVANSFHFSGLIYYDKISYAVSVPKCHTKVTQGILLQIEWLCLHIEVVHRKKTLLISIVCGKIKRL